MPYEIQPIGPSGGSSTYDFSPGGEWDWLKKQEVSYNRGWESIGSRSRGKILGGPTLSQAWSSMDPKTYTILPPPPPILSPILNGERLGPSTRVGTVELDLIDPFFTMTQLTGNAIGADQPLVGDEGRWFDPGMFLASKNMDLFGRGEVGLPARLTDYAFAFPIAILNKIRGIETPAEAAPGTYRFQQDPSYWGLIQAAQNDDDLRGLAATVAGRYVDQYRNGYLVEQLFQTFKNDRNMVTGLSSGNDRIDWIAKMSYAAQATRDATRGAVPFSAEDWSSATLGLTGFTGSLVSAIPFIGPGITERISPIPDQLDAMWRGLPIEERRRYLEDAGGAVMTLDIALMLPTLSGIGSALAVAKGAGGLAGKAFTAYDTVLRASAGLMATGVIAATTNWALEAAWPEYSELLGNEVDRARPISKSALAGIVNEVGFWSSGTFGALPAIQRAGRTVGKVTTTAGRVAEKVGIPHPTIGTQELGFFRYGYGGSDVRRELVGTGLSAQGVNTSVKASFLSHIQNWIERTRRQPYEAALRGGDTQWDDVNRMTFEEKQVWANDQLARGMSDGPVVAEGFLRILAVARRAAPINPAARLGAAVRRAHDIAKALDDELAKDVVREYGPDFIASSRMVGAYTPEAMAAWSKAKVTQLGGDASKLGRHDTEGWARIVRTLHQYEYHWWNGELSAAIERETLEEAGRLTVVRSDHIFRDTVDDALPILRGDNEAAARALIVSTIRTKAEAAEWFARTWKPKAGVDRLPENVEPAVFASWLEDISPALPTRRLNAAPGSETSLMPVNAMQRRLDEQGTWTLAFKPVDDAGNFISYTHTREGGVFKSPWVEYPLESVDNLELGNRGMLTSKLDSTFRGFRTWRITEFQRGSLFRSLTSDFDFLPAQIDEFHSAVLQIAREAKVQPQTIGSLAKLPELPFAVQTEDAIQSAATRIFGKGPFKTRAGVEREVDWPREVARAYEQSFKLNLTAGITSHLKSRLGAPGNLAAFGSDIIYVAFRFGMSPLFKGGELLESKVFNLMRGVIAGDPVTQALFYRGGLGNDFSVINSEMAYDQLARSLGGGSRSEASARARQASAMSFHARNLPEDFLLQRETVATQAAADVVAGSRPARFVVSDTGRRLVPYEFSAEEGYLYHVTRRRVADVVASEGVAPRATPGNLAGARQSWWSTGDPELIGRYAQTDDAVVLRTADGPGFEMGHGVDDPLTRRNVDVVPPDRIEYLGDDSAWHPISELNQPPPLDLPPLATAEDDLLRQLRATMAREPVARPPAYTEEGGLYAELNDLVGENGVYPGLESRASEILDRLDELARTQGDAGPVFRFAELSNERQRDILRRLFAEGDLPADNLQPTLGQVQEAYERLQRRPGATDRIEDIAGTPEAFGEVLRERAIEEAKKGGGFAEAWDTFWHPVDYKQVRSLELQTRLMETQFPALLRASGNDGLVQVFEQLGIREDRWARWLLEDRKLLDSWYNAKTPEALDALLAHAGGDAAERAAFNELYASEEWSTISALWNINLKSAADEAFGTHFFMPYRSAFERSINHPVLGIYPASWSLKAAREWAKFLFDNRMFGDLRLGMAPAQAIAELARAQATAFAMTNDDSLDHFLDKGPLGSTLFIFNLLMPGDWSALPFPLSRTIREILRGNTDPARVLTSNIDFMGVTRDARLFGESLGEIRDMIFGPIEEDPKKEIKGWSARGSDGIFGQPRR